MVLAADYPFMDVLWTMIIFFAWVVWIWMMVVLLGDVFRRTDIGGWAKAAWVMFMIVAPFLGALVYLIAQHDGIAERNMKQVEDAQAAFDARVREVAANGGGGGAASEIEKAKGLLDSGAITQPEFDSLKAKALAGG
jgi:hypothetical protein